jgi:hypothetical protein
VSRTFPWIAGILLAPAFAGVLLFGPDEDVGDVSVERAGIPNAPPPPVRDGELASQSTPLPGLATIAPVDETYVDAGDRGLVLAGRVVDVTGAPVSVPLHLFRGLRAPREIAWAESGPDGAFRFEGIPGPGPWELRAAHRDWLIVGESRVWRPNAEIVVEAAAPSDDSPYAVEIEVRSRDGESLGYSPDPKLDVRLAAEADWRPRPVRHARSTPGPAHASLRALLPRGTHRGRIRTWGFLDREFLVRVDGVTPPRVDVALDRSVDLIGLVHDFRGRPLGGVTLATPGRSTSAEPNGEFVLHGVPPGTNLVTVEGDHVLHGHQARWVVPGAELSEVVVEAGGAIRVGWQGAKGPTFQVDVRDSEGRSMRVEWDGGESRPATAVARGLRVGEYVVAVSIGRSELPAITVRVDEHRTTVVELRLCDALRSAGQR